MNKEFEEIIKDFNRETDKMLEKLENRKRENAIRFMMSFGKSREEAEAEVEKRFAK